MEKKNKGPSLKAGDLALFPRAEAGRGKRPKYCRLWERNAAGAKAHPLFCCICGTTKVVP
jgi:hypothetical protein